MGMDPGGGDAEDDHGISGSVDQRVRYRNCAISASLVLIDESVKLDDAWRGGRLSSNGR